jgi:hypothetical protein
MASLCLVLILPLLATALDSEDSRALGDIADVKMGSGRISAR